MKVTLEIDIAEDRAAKLARAILGQGESPLEVTEVAVGKVVAHLGQSPLTLPKHAARIMTGWVALFAAAEVAYPGDHQRQLAFVHEHLDRAMLLAQQE